MRHNDRPPRHTDNIEAGLFARVADIDQNTDFLHLAYEKAALTVQRGRRVKAATAKRIGEIIGEVGDPEPLFIIMGKGRGRRVNTPIVIMKRGSGSPTSPIISPIRLAVAALTRRPL